MATEQIKNLRVASRVCTAAPKNIGEYASWTDVPSTLASGVSVSKGDYITVLDASDFYTDAEVVTRTVYYAPVTSGGVTVNKIVSHLLIGQRVASDVLAGTTVIPKGTVLTSTHVAAIGDASIVSITLYVQKLGKWFLTYDGEDESAYAKDDWKFVSQMNDDVSIYLRLATMTGVIASLQASLSDISKRMSDLYDKCLHLTWCDGE